MNSSRHPVEWLVYVFMALAFAVTAAAIFPGCGDPYEDRNVDEDVCNEYCVDPDSTGYSEPGRCICGRIIEHYSSAVGVLVTECVCQCGNPEWEFTWDWCFENQ